MKTEKKPKPGRDEKGRWLPGTVSNPGGRPARAPEVIAFLNEHSMEACERLLTLMRTTADDKIQMQCIIAILDRTIGKPKNQVEVTTNETLTDLIRPIIIQQQEKDVTPKGDNNAT